MYIYNPRFLKAILYSVYIYEREIFVDVCFRGEKANEKRKMREKSFFFF